MNKFVYLPLCMAIGLTGVSLAQAQGGPPGDGPGGPVIPTEDTAEERAAKEVVQAWGDMIDEGKVREAFEMYVSRDFVDHSNTPRRMLNKQDIGYDETLQAFEMFIGPHEGTMVEEIYANANMVTISGKVGRDLFMVEDGKIIAHWDTMQVGRGPAASGGPPPGPPPQ